MRKKEVDFKQPRESPPSTTAQERLMVVAMGHTDDDYEAWTHIAMPRTHAGSVAVIHRVDASFRPCFLELLQASGCAHYVEVWVQEAWYS